MNNGYNSQKEIPPTRCHSTYHYPLNLWSDPCNVMKHQSTAGIQLHFTSTAIIAACVSPDKLVTYGGGGLKGVGTSCLSACVPEGAGIWLFPVQWWPRMALVPRLGLLAGVALLSLPSKSSNGTDSQGEAWVWLIPAVACTWLLVCA